MEWADGCCLCRYLVAVRRIRLLLAFARIQKLSVTKQFRAVTRL